MRAFARESNMGFQKNRSVKFNPLKNNNIVIEINDHDNPKVPENSLGKIPNTKITHSVVPVLNEFKKRKHDPLSLINKNKVCDNLKITHPNIKAEYNLRGYKAEVSYLDVAVTSTRGSISKAISANVQEGLASVLVNFAGFMNPDIKAPVFIGKPTYYNGTLRLRCVGQHTIDWLKWAVKYINVPGFHRLVVKELPRMIKCGIEIDTLTKDKSLVLKCFQLANSWAEAWRWEILDIIQQGTKCFVLLNIPQDLIPIILDHNRCLSYGLGIVFVKFLDNKGNFTDFPEENFNASVVVKSAKSVNDIHKYMGVGLM